MLVNNRESQDLHMSHQLICVANLMLCYNCRHVCIQAHPQEGSSGRKEGIRCTLLVWTRWREERERSQGPWIQNWSQSSCSVKQWWKSVRTCFSLLFFIFNNSSQLNFHIYSHIYLKHWYKSFPDLHIWLCPTRAHHTKNQQDIQKEYPDRWELADNTTTPHHVQQLLDYFDGVDVVLFNQLFVHADHRGGTWRECGDETKKFSNLDLFKSVMPTIGAQDSASDEPAFYYAPLKLIVTGHQWEVRPDCNDLLQFSL